MLKSVFGIWFRPTLFTAPLFSATKSLSTSCALGLVHVCTMQQNMNITPSLSHAYSLHISHVSNRTIYYYTIVPPSCYMLQIDYALHHFLSISLDERVVLLFFTMIVCTKLSDSLLSQCSTRIN